MKLRFAPNNRYDNEGNNVSKQVTSQCQPTTYLAQETFLLFYEVKKTHSDLVRNI